MLNDEALSPRSIRHLAEHKKLRRKSEQIAQIHPLVVRHSQDQSVMCLQSKAGFLPHDLVCMHIWTKIGSFTVILVPLRLWYSNMWKRRALELKSYLRLQGKRCVIAPASYVERQPRLQNAKLIASSRRCSLSTTDRLVLMSRIDQAIEMSLEEATSCVTGRDPAAAVLNLIAERTVSFDPDRPIGPHTLLSIRS